MEINYCVFDPTGNITALVETEVKPADQPAVAAALMQENFAHRYLINQIDTNPIAAQELAQLLTKPTVLACVQKGEIL